MKPVGFDTYSECVEKVLDGTVQAMSTDGTILAGYAAQNEGELKVVGDQFSEENIGSATRRTTRRCASGSSTRSAAAYNDGTYEEAFHRHARPVGGRDSRLPRWTRARVLWLTPTPEPGSGRPDPGSTLHYPPHTSTRVRGVP